MNNTEALHINAAMVHCYLFKHGITSRLKKEHVETVQQNSTLRLLVAAETTEAINADPEEGRTAEGRTIHAVVDAAEIPRLRDWAIAVNLETA